MTRLLHLASLGAAAILLLFGTGCPSPCALPIPNPEKLSFYMVNVGQGDAAFLLAPNGDRMLIDAGEPEPAQSSLLPVLSEILGEPEPFDVVIATHFHYDHVGGMQVLADEGWLSTSTVFYDPGEQGEANFGVYHGYTSATCGEECRFTPEPEEIIPFGGDAITVTVLAADGKIYPGGYSLDSSTNGRSIAVMISWGEFDLYTGGDLTTDVAEPLAGRGLMAGTDVYRAHHHGSNDGNTLTILDALSPQAVLVSLGNSRSCGPGYNRYGHPRQGFLNALRAVRPLPVLYQTETGGRAVDSDTFCEVQDWDRDRRDYGDLSVVKEAGHVLVQTNGSTFSISPECGERREFTAR